MTEEKRKKKKREGTVQDKRESVDCGNSETKEGKHGSLVGNSPRSPFELEPIHCSPNRLGRVEKKKEEEEGRLRFELHHSSWCRRRWCRELIGDHDSSAVDLVRVWIEWE